MRNYIKKYIPEESWRVSQIGWNKNLQAVRESHFTLGNGFIGSRGILEEVPFDGMPGTYIAGVYDKIGSTVADLVNLPCPVYFKVSVQGEKLDASIIPLSMHERHLNMKHGLLLRRSVYKTVYGNKINYQSIRFFSMANKHLAVMKIFIAPVSNSCTVTVESGINTSISNVSGLSEGRKRHFEIREVDVSASKVVSYHRIETLGSKISVAYAHTLHISVGKKSRFSNEDHFELQLKKNQTAVFTKIYSIFTKDETESFDIKSRSIRSLEQNVETGVDELFRQHCDAWDALWRNSDIKVRGNAEIQRNLRFNIYHMLITGIDNGGASSIGAKTLSGEGYRGHIFWDLEIFLLPFFIYTNPAVARSLLLYRINRLDKAREIARSKGYKGAMFPWESARTGEEETPTWARNLDGTVIRIRTNEFEHHITADIAYALYNYYIASGDEYFMLKYGYELIIETARFWASRVKFNKTKRKFEIRHVIGPDEFHEDINNNAFTNMLARWNVFIAHGMFMKMRKTHPDEHAALIEKIGMREEEVKKWERIVDNMLIRVRRDGVMEQFDGFFKRKKVKVTELDQNFMPVIPREVKLKHIGQYQIVKQADVIMLFHMFPGLFDKAARKRNYDFYVPITVHKSSLSPSVHAIVSLELGRDTQAFRYFRMSLNTDMENLHGNTGDGIHAANLGGTWQGVVNGFAGMKVLKGTLCFDPKIPAEIDGLTFSVHWKGIIFRVEAKSDTVGLKSEEPEGKNKNHIDSKRSRRAHKGIKVKVFGRLYNICPGETLRVKKGA